MTAVRRVGENALATYYAVSGKDTTTVRHGAHRERPFACLRCCTNECEHIDAVEAFLATQAV
jgi:hypothetical protein